MAYDFEIPPQESARTWEIEPEAIAANTAAFCAEVTSKYTPAIRLREIGGLPGIVEFLSEKSGQKVPPCALKVGGGMTFKKAGSYLKWTDEQIQNVVDELNEMLL